MVKEKKMDYNEKIEILTSMIRRNEKKLFLTEKDHEKVVFSREIAALKECRDELKRKIGIKVAEALSL